MHHLDIVYRAWMVLLNVPMLRVCPGQWDAVLTCFFIDTAQNIVSYIETIARLLREGGVWINLGPLLFHFEVRDHACDIHTPTAQLCVRSRATMIDW